MSDTLTKAHIGEAVAEANGYTRNKSFEIVEILLELIKSALESGRMRAGPQFVDKFCRPTQKRRE